MKIKRIVSVLLTAAIFVTSLMCGAVTASAASEKCKLIVDTKSYSQSGLRGFSGGIFIVDGKLIRVGEKELEAFQKTGKLTPTTLKTNFKLPERYNFLGNLDKGVYLRMTEYDKDGNATVQTVLKYDKNKNEIKTVKKYSGEWVGLTGDGYVVRNASFDEKSYSISIPVEKPNGGTITNTIKLTPHYDFTSGKYEKFYDYWGVYDSKYMYVLLTAESPVKKTFSDGSIYYTYTLMLQGVKRDGTIDLLTTKSGVENMYIKGINNEFVFYYGAGYGKVTDSNLYLFDSKKNIYIPNTVESIISVNGNRAVTRSGDAYQLLDISKERGAFVGKAYKSMSTADGKIYLVQNSNGKWGYIDSKGKELAWFDYASDFGGEYAPVVKSGKAYLIDKNMKQVSLTASAEYAWTAYDGLYLLANGDKFSFMTYKGGASVSAPSNVKAKKAASGKAKISWGKVSGANGYEVYMATSKDGKYSKIKTISKASTVSMTKSKLTAGKTYYFKVRAYKTVDGKKVYSKYSDVKSVKV